MDFHTPGFYVGAAILPHTKRVAEDKSAARMHGRIGLSGGLRNSHFCCWPRQPDAHPFCDGRLIGPPLCGLFFADKNHLSLSGMFLFKFCVYDRLRQQPPKELKVNHLYDSEDDGTYDHEDISEGTICPACSGSGEGMYDGTQCDRCKGCGEVAR